YFDEPEKMVKRIKAAYEIAKGAGCRGMVAGQVSDIEGEGADFSNEMLEYIHINKTGALIRSSIKAGLYLGNPTSYMLDNLDHYAENLGLAYQIADDILDVIGNPEELGKATGSDEKKQKNTYTSINGLEAAYKRLDELTDSAVEAIAPYYDNAEFFRNLVLQLKRRKK
ncbi:MAG: polyprenyl synthetase family protein, partial [Firmicutes bacterium]|nr:polyprenyl synthetase family protein [Bacillota bacterium]